MLSPLFSRLNGYPDETFALFVYTLYRVLKKKATLNIHECSLCFKVQTTFGPLGFEKACNRILSAQFSLNMNMKWLSFFYTPCITSFYYIHFEINGISRILISQK